MTRGVKSAAAALNWRKQTIFVDYFTLTSEANSMHGRVPPRPSSVSRLPRRSPSQTLSSCKEKRPTNLVVPKESTTSTLREFLCKVFVDAQASTVGHRKLIISLRKIQESCCYEPAKPGKEGQKDFNEDDFNVEIARCVIRFMGVKKSEVVGDRIIRFLGQFLRHASEKGSLFEHVVDGPR